MLFHVSVTMHLFVSLPSIFTSDSPILRPITFSYKPTLLKKKNQPLQKSSK